MGDRVNFGIIDSVEINGPSGKQLVTSISHYYSFLGLKKLGCHLHFMWVSQAQKPDNIPSSSTG